MPPPAPFSFLLLPFFPSSHLQTTLPFLFHCLLLLLLLQIQEQLLFCPLIFNYKDQTLDVDFGQFKDHTHSISIILTLNYIYSNPFIFTFIQYIHHVYIHPLSFLAFFRIGHTVFPISQSFQPQSFGQTKAHLDTRQHLWRYQRLCL